MLFSTNLSKHVVFFCRRLPREVDPLVYNMSHEDPGNITYAEIGGLNEQIRELREVCTVSHQISLFIISSNMLLIFTSYFITLFSHFMIF